MTNNPSQHEPSAQPPQSPQSSQSGDQPEERVLGRNEPCPCGSGKKYKRCHGVAAAPKLSQPRQGEMPADFAAGAGAGGMPQMPPGMEHMTPEMMGQVASMLQRLPKGQLQRLQSIMQRAMSGKDVAREAEEFQKMLPPEFQQMLMAMTPAAAMMGGQAALPGAATAQGASPVSGTSGEMSEDEARKIVEEAVAAGKISANEAAPLLEEEKSKGLGKFWRNLKNK